MLTSEFAADVEKNLGLDLDEQDYINLVASIQAAGSEKNQRHTASVFKKLSRVDLIKRCKLISKLTDTLYAVRNNTRKNDIQTLQDNK